MGLQQRAPTVSGVSGGERAQPPGKAAGPVPRETNRCPPPEQGHPPQNTPEKPLPASPGRHVHGVPTAALLVTVKNCK